MTSTLRRAGGFAVVGTLALAAPSLGTAAFAPFAAVALLAAFVIDDGPLFELFARPGDREDGRLNGLAGFALAATGLALLATVPRVKMPLTVFVAAVLLLAYGNLGARLVESTTDDEFLRSAGFVTAAVLAGTAGQVVIVVLTGELNQVQISQFTFLAALGGLVATLLRTTLYERDDPLVMLSVGLSLWGFNAIAGPISPTQTAVSFAFTIAIGYAAYALGTASIAGVITGVLLLLLTIGFGGFGWAVVLVSFFGVGALATKFKYDQKAERGVAEGNDGARGTGNVLGNAAVALVSVIGYATTQTLGHSLGTDLFVLAFAGSVAAAMSDTLSSEIGGLFDNPRLITSFKPVPPGTDGGVTWQGEVAGIVGSALIAGVASVLLPLSTTGAVAVLAGGIIGMTVDSLLGATVEGAGLGNQAVNFLATLAGALGALAVWIPL
ncbi:DUF92 domain-containing protein [Haloferax mediterranei ATCC 33500]|uniref:DUF92 domain-containing protein n=1 Tax=Haloferax mediterranei (strain ATCC 33500 / DSM 1411 / JCM 8866 / NBRC 14739 / NCIMB 2177 / R-4) TaxID=523841 RepID=I3R705_HALMT|nr:DUF92 domain-containing protein [Haloferax mediterranei]AFK20015.2 hypothetical protein HFX_2328 [Haloferax mediterranei ATCC 33500]AHZ23393.1 hypothetical protein BM92_12420 [Haloferax mediterranei ATCC 33500]ELZ99562.1 hypothetical protein C439_13449 [Haloferax mediterranei ATCC 33500]MDX5987233.1 DUF92 domain-containing protein [Haloferax mediterranei ATCC 33500]QCQ73755.1 DUF92 domain-containing protein [Haloferax mediterranei ATCC 33500]